MKRVLFVVSLLAGATLMSCSSPEEDVPIIENSEFLLSDEVYERKVNALNGLMDRAGWEDSVEPYDFYSSENRRHLESGNLIDFEIYIMELMSREGLRMDENIEVMKEVANERLSYKWNYYQSTSRYWYHIYGKTKYLNYSLF